MIVFTRSWLNSLGWDLVDPLAADKTGVKWVQIFQSQIWLRGCALFENIVRLDWAELPPADIPPPQLLEDGGDMVGGWSIYSLKRWRG